MREFLMVASVNPRLTNGLGHVPHRCVVPVDPQSGDHGVHTRAEEVPSRVDSCVEGTVRGGGMLKAKGKFLVAELTIPVTNNDASIDGGEVRLVDIVLTALHKVWGNVLLCRLVEPRRPSGERLAELKRSAF